MTGMEHKTWMTVDKATWGDGPWQGEPDKEQWTDPATGYACLLKRSSFSGSLCGYVGVPEGHPWHGRSPAGIAPGGRELTYGELCQEGPDEYTICHVPGPGEPDALYWLGFHCGYIRDIQPGREARDREHGWPPIRDGGETYKTAEYVKEECARLAAQAAAAA
jgi:hypothetical protein